MYFFSSNRWLVPEFHWKSGLVSSGLPEGCVAGEQKGLRQRQGEHLKAGRVAWGRGGQCRFGGPRGATEALACSILQGEKRTRRESWETLVLKGQGERMRPSKKPNIKV